MVYFHNLSYDCKFIFKSTYPIQNLLQADGKQIQFSIHTPECEIVFRDTLRIYGADCALSKLPKMFLSKEEQSKIYKEIMPYDRYTKERYLGIMDDIAEAFKSLKGIKMEEFINSLTKANALLPNGKYNMQIYAEYYC